MKGREIMDGVIKVVPYVNSKGERVEIRLFKDSSILMLVNDRIDIELDPQEAWTLGVELKRIANDAKSQFK